MLLPGIVAATLMAAACAVMSIDSPLGKMALYRFYRWQRRRRSQPATLRAGLPSIRQGALQTPR
jgi:hypothetical protein